MNKTKLWMMAAILLICGSAFLTSCSSDDDPVVPTDEVEAQLQKMSLRESSDVIAHHYFDVDAEVVYSVITKEIEPLKAAIEIFKIQLLENQ